MTLMHRLAALCFSRECFLQGVGRGGRGGRGWGQGMRDRSISSQGQSANQRWLAGCDSAVLAAAAPAPSNCLPCSAAQRTWV